MTGRRPPEANERAWRAAAWALAVLMVSAGVVVLAALGLSGAAGAAEPPASITTPLSTARPSTTSPPTSRAPTSTASTGPTTTPPTNHTPVTTARATPAGVAPTPTYSYPTYPRATYAQPTTTVAVATTTTTTIAPLPGAAGSPLVTVPLVTRSPNGHFDTSLGWLSLGGFAVAGGIIAGRLFVTRPGRTNRL